MWNPAADTQFRPVSDSPPGHRLRNEGMVQTVAFWSCSRDAEGRNLAARRRTDLLSGSIYTKKDVYIDPKQKGRDKREIEAELAFSCNLVGF